MNILHIVWWGELGGIALNLLDFVSHYQRPSDVIAVCVIDTRSTITDTLESFGVTVTRIGAKSGSDVNAFHRLCSFLRAQRFDIIHNHTNTYFVSLALVLAAPRAAKVCQEHDAIRIHSAKRAIYYRSFGRVYDRFVAVSDRTAADLARVGAPRSRILTITNPVDGKRFTPALPRRDAKRAFGLSESLRVVGTACRFAPEKDLLLFLDVASRIAQKDANVAFLMVGSGTQAPTLQRRISQLGLQHVVHCPGEQRDMAVVWRAMDVYLFTSLAESFSRSILESLAAETPVVAALPRDGGAIDLIRGGRGILADEARDPDHLTTLVLRLLNSPEERDTLGKHGRAWAVTTFNVDNWIAAFYDLYHSLCPHV